LCYEVDSLTNYTPAYVDRVGGFLLTIRPGLSEIFCIRMQRIVLFLQQTMHIIEYYVK